jgi:hypothetical protein
VARQQSRDRGRPTLVGTAARGLGLGFIAGAVGVMPLLWALEGLLSVLRISWMDFYGFWDPISKHLFGTLWGLVVAVVIAVTLIGAGSLHLIGMGRVVWVIFLLLGFGLGAPFGATALLIVACATGSGCI